MFYFIYSFGKLQIEREWYSFGWQYTTIASILPGHEDDDLEPVRTMLQQQFENR